MKTYSEKSSSRKARPKDVLIGGRNGDSSITDNRSEAVAQRESQRSADNGPQGKQLQAAQQMADAHSTVVQRRWKNDSATVSTRAEMSQQMGIPIERVDESEEAGRSLLDGSVFLVAPSADLKKQLVGNQPLRAMPEAKHIVGESEHGAGTWPTATAPWSYVPKAREKYKTFEKADEGRIAKADAGIEQQVGGDERDQAGDIALEGQSEYSVSALSIAQQLLKGYDSVYESTGKDAAKAKSEYTQMLLSRLGEARLVLMRYRAIGVELFGGSKLTAKEQKIVNLALYIEAHEGFKIIKEVTKGGEQGDVTKLGGFWQKHVGEKIQTMQELIEKAVNDIIAFEKFKGMKSIQDLNRGRERDLSTWSDRTVSAITSPATRDIREDEMARRINAAPAPVLVQVGKAHIAGLTTKGAVGTMYGDEADFVTKTSKANTPDVYETRMKEDSGKHRTMNLWGR